jgi:cytochrome c biogenesis protein ResB
MSRGRLYRRFLSARFTVGLLCLLALLLLLNVALPQESVLGEERYAAVLDESGAGTRFVLETLGFGRMATSPVFLTVLALFFLNLASVLLARFKPTWHRVALKPRSEKGLRAWARMEETHSAPLPENWSAGRIVNVLRGHGYQVRRPGKQTFWAVKHRTAPLGFLLFHLSFFLICAGGVAIYYTRFVATATVSEGQLFVGDYNTIVRASPLGGPPTLRFTVEEIEARMENDEPVHLGARLRFEGAGPAGLRQSRVNHPASWGASSILVERAGVAPVLWLQDERGFTLDRVVTPARTRAVVTTEVPMADGEWKAVVYPLLAGEPFPRRQELAQTSMDIEIWRGDDELFNGELRPGEAAAFPGGRLVMEELRYWVGLRVIRERGGGLLIVGFTLGVIGLVWRLLWYRREIALTWEDGVFRLVGRSEYFSAPFEEELASLARMLRETEATAGRPAAGSQEGTTA